ncbi:Serpentine receptor class r-10 [Caenorhabditis elegans]|uniref:Serpentine receptor class r-10 n=1 Tax=Caenorhabditis elegans TaxID=6239 RepID=O45737_CAEEL|nr:Seven TM Receptor [Caenorhabditis elegans]CAB07278.2 Seven TM Receptor [Caenorhabditis elegans]|eukprot:NP_507196.2 Seven TM Receptor [Caenorhabditis elegans]
MPLWLHVIQHAGFFFAQITNGILVYLIATKAQKLFGTYRHLMCAFAVFSLIYAWVEVFTQPVMHIKGPVFIVFMDSPLKYQAGIGNFVTCLYCGSFALVISLLASQFSYRFIAVCRPELLPKLDGLKLVIIFIPCVFFFILWFELVYWGMENTKEKQEYMREELETFYQEDSRKVCFIAPMYWSIGKNGEKIWNFFEIGLAFGCVMIIVVCFTTILFCSINIYYFMTSIQCHMSKRTLELNHQLFVTLSFQTLLPFVMMYSPVGLLFCLPLFEVYGGDIANYVGATLALYPALEPLIAIFTINEFRRTFMNFHRKKVQTTVTVPTLTPTMGVVD